MMKSLEEYELIKRSKDELFGFTISCFVKNGIVWNEYYVSYSDLPLNMINDLFYQDDDMAVQTYINLPVAYLNEDQDIDTLMNTYIMYSPKYNFPSITYPNFTCNINEHMEVEAIHSIDFNGNPLTVDIRIDHKNNVIYVTNVDNPNREIHYFYKFGRITKVDLIYDSILTSTDEFSYDDINHEILECTKDESGDIVYTVKTKTDDNGRKLYMVGFEDDDEISIITRRINLNEDLYIELSKFRTHTTFEDIDFDD